MRLLEMETGDSIAIDALADQSFERGIGLDELENALIHASANGWILAADKRVHLTGNGYKLLNPANDNSRSPPRPR